MIAIDGVHAERGRSSPTDRYSCPDSSSRPKKAGVFRAAIFRRRHLHKHREQGIDQRVGAVGQSIMRVLVSLSIDSGSRVSEAFQRDHRNID